jgi:hypothetical protein
MLPKDHFRQSCFGKLFKDLGSQSIRIGLNCSSPVTGPTTLDSYENEEASETLGAGSTTTLRPSASSVRMSFRR